MASFTRLFDENLDDAAMNINPDVPLNDLDASQLLHDSENVYFDPDEFFKDLELPMSQDELSTVSPDEVVNENLYFDSEGLLKELESSQNEFSLPMSHDHFATEKVDDIVLEDITHEPSKNDFSLPKSPDNNFATEKIADVTLGDNGHANLISTSSLVPSKKYKRWTQKEQRLFLVGLQRYGWGNWTKISKNYVLTRTNTQVASHAQKYLQRVKAPKERKKRRSIHDVALENISVMAPPSNAQQYWIPTQNSGTQQPQRVQQLENWIPAPNFAMQQPRLVQQSQHRIPTSSFASQQPHQFSYMPCQINGFRYLGGDPHCIEQQNWIPPIQSHEMQKHNSSQYNLTDYIKLFPMEDIQKLQSLFSGKQEIF